MKIKPTIDDNRLRQKFTKQIQTQPRQVQIALGRTAEFLMDIIKTRTQKGKDADRRSFLPYKPEYKAFRRKEGRQVKYPDLNFSGQMLSGMVQRANPKQAVLFFQKFQNIKAVRNQKKRPFFLIGDNERKTLINFFAKEFKKLSVLK